MLVATCAIARAQLPSQISIRWSAPEACPKAANFDLELARRLGPNASEAQPMELRVEIEALAESGYQLTLEAEGARASTQRSVEVETCEDAQRAAALLIATALAPRADGELEHQAAPLPARPPWSLRIGVLGDLAAVQGVSGGPSLGVGHDLSALRLWLDARYLFARETGAMAAARAQIDLFTLAPGAAYTWSLSRFWLGPALELELGALRGRAAGERENGARAAPWIAAFVGALVGVDFNHVSLTLSVALGVPLLRPEFVLEDESILHRTRAVTGRAQLGVKIPLGRSAEASKKAAEGGQW